MRVNDPLFLYREKRRRTYQVKRMWGEVTKQLTEFFIVFSVGWTVTSVVVLLGIWRGAF